MCVHQAWLSPWHQNLPPPGTQSYAIIELPWRPVEMGTESWHHGTQCHQWLCPAYDPPLRNSQFPVPVKVTTGTACLTRFNSQKHCIYIIIIIIINNNTMALIKLNHWRRKALPGLLLQIWCWLRHAHKRRPPGRARPDPGSWLPLTPRRTPAGEPP